MRLYFTEYEENVKCDVMVQDNLKNERAEKKCVHAVVRFGGKLVRFVGTWAEFRRICFMADKVVI